MTPTEQDKMIDEELYQSITDICFESGGVTKPMADKLLQLITADRKRVELEARIDELEKIEIGGDNIWTVDSGTDTAMLIEERINELKAKQEEL